MAIIAQKCNQWDKIYPERCLFSDNSTVYSQEQFIKTEDIIINSTGRGTVGRTGIVEQRLFKTYDKYVVDSHVTLVRCVKNFVSSKYIYYLLITSYIQNSVEDNCTGSTNQQELRTDVICNYKIPLPPLNEQKRIVARIEELLPLVDEYSKAQEALDKLNAKLPDDLRKSILQQAIEGKLVPQDPNDEPASELLKRINPNLSESCDNPHYENLPQTWIGCKISDTCDVIMGQSPDGISINQTNGTEFHQGKIAFDSIYLKHSNIYTTLPTKIAPPYSIVLCVRAPVGIPNITNREICIGRGLCAITCSKEINIKFLFYELKTMQNYFEGHATGSTFKAISSSIVKNSIVYVPPLNEQKRIVAKIEQLFSTLDTITTLLK